MAYDKLLNFIATVNTILSVWRFETVNTTSNTCFVILHSKLQENLEELFPPCHYTWVMDKWPDDWCSTKENENDFYVKHAKIIWIGKL